MHHRHYFCEREKEMWNFILPVDKNVSLEARDIRHRFLHFSHRRRWVKKFLKIFFWQSFVRVKNAHVLWNISWENFHPKTKWIEKISWWTTVKLVQNRENTSFVIFFACSCFLCTFSFLRTATRIFQFSIQFHENLAQVRISILL